MKVLNIYDGELGGFGTWVRSLWQCPCSAKLLEFGVKCKFEVPKTLILVLVRKKGFQDGIAHNACVTYVHWRQTFPPACSPFFTMNYFCIIAHICPALSFFLSSWQVPVNINMITKQNVIHAKFKGQHWTHHKNDTHHQNADDFLGVSCNNLKFSSEIRTLPLKQRTRNLERPGLHPPVGGWEGVLLEQNFSGSKKRPQKDQQFDIILYFGTSFFVWCNWLIRQNCFISQLSGKYNSSVVSVIYAKIGYVGGNWWFPALLEFYLSSVAEERIKIQGERGYMRGASYHVNGTTF